MSSITFISNNSFLASMKQYFDMALYIAEKGGLFTALKTSTKRIAKDTGIPQQTISRRLSEMENLIEKAVSAKGISLKLKKPAIDMLKQYYNRLDKALKVKNMIKGKVKDGIGEGSYYVSQPGYQKQFEKKLGFKAYPGTLNIRISQDDLLSFLADKNPIIIEGFKTRQRTFGSLECYPVSIGSTKAAIVMPKRSRHPVDMIEIIAPVKLKKDKDIEVSRD